MDECRQIRIIADTNVWLDRFIPNRSGRDAANRFFASCSRKDVMLLYPPHTPQDVFFMVAKEAKNWIRAEKGYLPEGWGRAANTHAWECVRSMDEMATMAGVDQGDLWLAFKYRDLHPDLEDDLVIAVAQRVKADYLVTSDKRLIEKAPVAALTPEDMSKVLAAR